MNTITKTYNIVLTFVISIILLLLSPFITGFLNESLLLENKIVIYNSIFSENSDNVINLPDDYENHENAYNYIHPMYCSTDMYGMSIRQNDDCSITLNGLNSGPGFDCLIGVSSLPDGQYRLTDGTDAPYGGYICAIGNAAISTSANTTDSFTVNADNRDVLIYLHINQGSTADNITLYPMLTKGNGYNEEYIPYSLPENSSDIHARARLIRLTQDLYESMSIIEKMCLKNYIRYSTRGRYQWVTIDFCNGNGIQYIDCMADSAVQGPIDAWGRVM